MMIRKTLQRFRLTALALVGLTLIPSMSWAGLVIDTGNGSPNNTLNLLEATGVTGTLFHATDGALGSVMTITTDQTGTAQGTGQAQVDAIGTNYFTTVTFAADTSNNVLGWKGFEVNPDFSVKSGTFKVYGKDDTGATTESDFTITSGSNFFYILPGTVQYITSVEISTAPDAVIKDVSQFRIGDVVTTASVPEPSTLASAGIAGFLLLGYGLRRRARRSA